MSRLATEQNDRELDAATKRVKEWSCFLLSQPRASFTITRYPDHVHHLVHYFLFQYSILRYFNMHLITSTHFKSDTKKDMTAKQEASQYAKNRQFIQLSTN